MKFGLPMLLFLSLFCLPAHAVAATIYVNADASGDNDGSSWNNACTDLQNALTAATSGDEIWVAAGTYYPSAEHWGDGDRYKSFQMIAGVALYGGFDGTETSLEDRDISANETILSGDIGTTGDASDNCYHVFYHPSGLNLTATAILDGFTVTGGNADGANSHRNGGGMYNLYNSPTITNCTFSGNAASLGGGGMYSSYSSPTVKNCTFSGNATYYGGGMHNLYNSPTITNCTFSGNSSAGYGGGICNFYGTSSPTLTNCTFSGNSAFYSGGGVYSNNGSPKLTNCTFSGNSASSGGGMYNWNYSSPTLTNCILWGNTAFNGGAEIYNHAGDINTVVTYSNIAGGYEGDGNINTDPLFVRNPGTNGSDDYGDLHLTAASPCIDAGDNTTATSAGITTDMDGETRTNGTDDPVDMGADEMVDADGDGMPDYWETLYGVSDPDEDPDDDGLTTLEELSTGTSPVDADSDDNGTNDGDEDYDGDGLTNLSELDTHHTPANVADTDGDGYSDGAEIDRGSDPTDSGSVPESMVLYVKTGSAGEDDGTSWADAFDTLQEALDGAVSGDEIWVAAGTYTPSTQPTELYTEDTRYNHFALKSGVALYGGFDGTETARDSRNVSANETILSGDIGTTGDTSDNCHHVFYHPAGLGLTDTAILDGFTVTGGYADGDYPHSRGGGMFNGENSPTLTNCTFSGNVADYGGGICNYQGSPTLTNCTFSGNAATYGGGGMYSVYSSPTLTNCTFSGNAAADYGGGMYNLYHSPTLTNCTFSGNAATYGGAVDNYQSSPTLTNCILWGDTASTDGAEIYNDDDDSTPVVTYSNIAGGYEGTGNTDVDPEFVSGTDLHLTADSPCIDAGSGDAAADIEMDMDGEARIFGDAIDMGADEFVDTDGDGSANRLDSDDDDDGLSDEDEAAAGTNPLIADTDGDGLSDGTEIENGLSPTTAEGPGIPALVSPGSGAAQVDLTPELAVAYGDNATGDAHQSTRWQIAEDAAFAAIILDITSEADLLALTVPDLVLDGGTEYFWRVCFTGTDALTRSWSDTGTFTTADGAGGGGGCFISGISTEKRVGPIYLAGLLLLAAGAIHLNEARRKQR